MNLDANKGKLILRLATGFLMLLHGLQKIMNPSSLDFIRGQLSSNGLPQELAYGVYLGEVIAPLMIILGVFSRVGGMFIAGNMLFAIFLVHMGEIFSLNESGGWAIELQAFYLFSGLAILFLGSGRYAMRPD